MTGNCRTTRTWDKAPDRGAVVGQGTTIWYKKGCVFGQGSVDRAVVVGCHGTWGCRDACRRRLLQHTDGKRN